MSHAYPTSTSSDFQLIFDEALKAYKKRTKTDLLTHPLADRLETCHSASSILEVLQGKVQELNQSQQRNETWARWLDPTVKVLHAFSETLRKGVGLAFPSAKPIFTAVGVLLLAAKNVRASQGVLFEIFERLEAFFQRLEVYIGAALDQKMMDTVTKIMVEVLNIIGVATNEIKRGQIKKYMRKLFSHTTDIEDALKRLDNLTQEEVQMAAAQVLRATHTVDDTGRVRGVADIALSVDDQVKAVDDKLARQDLRRWLSPPDPSTNHNIASNAHHKGTANWFFEGRTYKEWKSTDSDSLLWVHGKPGSGKSILCSTIIEDVKTMCNAGQASMAYFYFDFRDINKQHWRDLVSSLLTQLSSHSDLRCDILSRLYSDHDNGAQQASDGTLTRCLKDMLTLPDRHPTYLIIDALDECSNISGIPTPRKRVLLLVKELIDLHLPNVHICVTSRPEVDIQDVIEPLTSCRVSLHDQSGQRKDIEDYVRSVVYLDSEPIMRRWRKEDKELVIKILSERADGMFRWIFCQLEVLRDCLPSSVRRTLDELPESLDETYERILKEIKKPNRAHARRVLQCLVVAIRPLRVAELAEVLAVDFDDAEGIPRLKADWRWEEQELALQSACSSLIVIVQAGGSPVVQFSHFSVKEFLTSARLATASGEVSNYYINLRLAHTILAQACLGVLLQTQDNIEGHTLKGRPLARYAAQHWTTHTRFGEVSPHLQKGIEYLFDADEPYFNAWLRIYNIDNNFAGSAFYLFTPIHRSPATPLYYAALCGFHDLVERLITKNPQDVEADGGYYVRPLVAALAGEHFQTADLLRHTVQPIRGFEGTIPLHGAAYSGNFEVSRVLIEYDPAGINASSKIGWTPLHYASLRDVSKVGSVLRLLLEHGADMNVQTQKGRTPLHVASDSGALEAVRLLLEHGADAEVKDGDGMTALQVAANIGHDEVVKLLREHRAK